MRWDQFWLCRWRQSLVLQELTRSWLTCCPTIPIRYGQIHSIGFVRPASLPALAEQAFPMFQILQQPIAGPCIRTVFPAELLQHTLESIIFLFKGTPSLLTPVLPNGYSMLPEEGCGWFPEMPRRLQSHLSLQIHIPQRFFPVHGYSLNGTVVGTSSP